MKKAGTLPGRKAFQPLAPRVIREEIITSIKARESVLGIAADISKRLRSGEWDAVLAAGGHKGATFDHLRRWKVADWAAFVKRLRAQVPAYLWRPPGTYSGRGGLTQSIRGALQHDAKVRAVKRQRQKIVEEEAAERESIETVSPEIIETEAAKNLELMRRALMKEMPIKEYVGLLTAHARGDNPGMAREALKGIINIMGIDTASKRNSDVPPPPPPEIKIPPIFQLPEGTGGPAIR